MKEKEDLLTQDEIQEVLLEGQNPKYSEPYAHGFGFSKTSIFKLSRQSGLILIHGNHDTGYEHIFLRHSPSVRSHWKDDKMENPSKFRLNVAPVEYLPVASGIFKPENKNIEKNKRSDVFDLYIGKYKHFDGLEIEYRLITYKDTGIIHTFFVNEKKKPFNKEKILDLKQGFFSSSEDLMSGNQTYELSYYNEKDIEVYKVIVRYIAIEQIERWYIQVNTDDGEPKLTTLISESENTGKMLHPFFQAAKMDYSYDGLITPVEKIIKQIIKNNYSF